MIIYIMVKTVKSVFPRSSTCLRDKMEYRNEKGEKGYWTQVFFVFVFRQVQIKVEICD